MRKSHYRSKEEQLNLGERAVDLRDIDGLKWRVISEMLKVHDIATTVVYYKKYKASLVKAGMSFEQIEEFSTRHKIEPGWVWLYENGFKRRVPQEIKGEIETAKMRDC